MPLHTFFLDAHGCAKNQVDAEIIITRLCDLGLVQTFLPENADLIIINSCGFIESAKKESLEAVCSARKHFPQAKILLSGCLSERYADELSESLSEADAIFGNGDVSKIDEIIKMLDVASENETSEKTKNRICVKYPQSGVFSGMRKTFIGSKASAYVKITEGCSNHCSFCAIPLIRGEVRSRSISDIVFEIENLVESGIIEINLIGQDLAAFDGGLDKSATSSGGEMSEFPLCTLLNEIAKIPKNFFLRLLYIHPDHFDESLLQCVKNNPKILPYFDVPFQSGDDKIIKAMNRTGRAEKYLNLVNEIKKTLPDAVIRTTFLTGFPGETDEAFENTKAFLKKIKPLWSGCFPYSKEEGTKAFSFKNQISKKVSKKRANELVEIQQEITREMLKNYVGETLDVLIEEVFENAECDRNENAENNATDTDEGLAIGRAWFSAPEVDGNVVLRYDKNNFDEVNAVVEGKIIKVKILSSSDVDLEGKVII